MISAIWWKLKDLMEGHIRHPDVILRVHRDHVWEEEEILAPAVDCVPGCVHRYNGVERDWFVAFHRVGVITKKKGLCLY